MAVIAFYGTLYLFVKMVSPKSKKVEVIAAPHTPQGDEIPSPDSAAFGEWIAAPGNIERLLDSAK